jgi:NAD(P)-dependent dehydrogenase (short-subunit alcohol dehydrogenase family)
MTQTTQLTAIVTGAARGIGLATTQLFLSKGYRVAMVDRVAPELKKIRGG